MINILQVYCDGYKRSPGTVIKLFKESLSVKMQFAFIRNTCQRNGALAEAKETGKDFTEWCKKNTEERWSGVLNDVLILIYAINCEVKISKRHLAERFGY